MRSLILTLMAVVLCAWSAISLPIALMTKSEGINKGVFKHIKLGKISFLFDVKNRNYVKEVGIITPFFLMLIKGYIVIVVMVVMSIIYFTVCFDSIATMGYQLLTWITISFVTNEIVDLVILIATRIISKKRGRSFDKYEGKRYKRLFWDDKDDQSK